MEDLNIQTVGRDRLSDTVKQKLTDLLIGGKLKPGDVLPSESDLANQFGVSKPVVREALTGLAAMGVVEIKQGKPATISVPTSAPLIDYLKLTVSGTKRGLQEAIELRRILEVEIVALAAQRISESDIEQLRAALNRMRDSIGTVEPWLEADLQIHRQIARSTKSTLITYLVEALSGLFRESMYILHTQYPQRDTQATLDRHAKIIDALTAHDVKAAREAMNAHFEAVEPYMLEIAAATAK